jgi:hypothetical protein
MIRPARGIIGLVRELGSRALIGFGVIVAAVVAIGYGFIYLGIAEPPGSGLATLDVPPAGAVAATLDDGLPVFVTTVDGEPMVLDARAPHVDGEADRLLSWCVEAGFFADLAGGGSFAASGEVLGGSAATGLRRFAVEPVDGGARVTVTPETSVAGDAPGETVASDCVTGSAWVAHAPSDDEVFDPSVAADQEPEGWFWVEGRLDAFGDEVRLCDGLDGGCATYAEVAGIDPARVEPVSGRFLGRVQDDAIRDLVIVPDIAVPGGSS